MAPEPAFRNHELKPSSLIPKGGQNSDESMPIHGQWTWPMGVSESLVGHPHNQFQHDDLDSFAETIRSGQMNKGMRITFFSPLL